MEGTLYCLKCTYSPGLFSTDYSIKFKSTLKNQSQGCTINKSHMKIVNNEEGLAKIILKSIDENEALIVLNDAMEGRKAAFYVPKSEIVENSLISNVLK